MIWRFSHRADPIARPLADRHYTRQKIGATQFVPPGRCLVLRTPEGDALWVTSWPFGIYVRHAWPGAWICSLFRNESPRLSSEMIREAVAITRGVYGEPPDLGFVSFVDACKVRHKRDPGRCFLRAGFRRVGETKGGLLVFQMLPEAMPEPIPPRAVMEAMLGTELRSGCGELLQMSPSEPLDFDSESA